MTPLVVHYHKWSNCQRCSLAFTRQNIVLARGSIPCDILFVGEAPGESEDILGQPFIGPAGHLLEYDIIKPVLSKFSKPYSWAMTNLVACIPLNAEGSKTSQPFPEEIKKCVPRLQEFVDLCKPKLIVCAGVLPERHVPANIEYSATICTIKHPAAILRMNTAVKGLEVQKCRVILVNAIEDMEKFVPQPKIKYTEADIPF